MAHPRDVGLGSRYEVSIRRESHVARSCSGRDGGSRRTIPENDERYPRAYSNEYAPVLQLKSLSDASNHPRRAVVATQRTESVTTRGHFSNRSRGITVPALRRTLALPVSGSSLLPTGYCRVRSFNSFGPTDLCRMCVDFSRVEASAGKCFSLSSSLNHLAMVVRTSQNSESTPK